MNALVILAALAGGLALGAAASWSGAPWLVAIVSALEPIGTLFINSVRMAVVPLMVGSLITGIAAVGDARALARLGARSFAVFALLATAAAVLTAALAVPILARLDIAPVLASASASTAPTAPSISEWLVGVVPANPIKAAADGAMLPLIVFTLLFGVALTRVSPERRQAVTLFFGGLSEAMMVVIRWVVALAPIGVFALAAPLAGRMGAGVAGTLFSYVLLASGLTVVALALIVYPATAVLSRIPLRRLVPALIPAQMVAFSSRSTMASVPAMVETTARLGVPDPVIAFVVPLAASTLRVGSAVGQTLAALVAAKIYGVTLPPAQLAAVVATTVLTTFAVPGVPGGSILVMVPVLLAAGVPAEAVGILLGADVIPDMFRTMANVTGGISAAAILGRTSVAEPVAAGFGDAEPEPEFWG